MAFQRDYRALELERRLSQIEIEHLVFHKWRLAEESGSRTPVTEMEKELSTLLERSGQEPGLAAEICQALREAEQPGAVMGPVLDQLAFETDVDLERLRVVLVEIWNGYRDVPQVSAPPKPTKGTSVPSRAEGLGAQLARRIEEGLSAKEDVEELFDEVAEMLGEDIDDEPEEVAGVAQGDLEPLIQEFLWEHKCEAGPENAVLSSLLAQQQEAPVPKVDLEYLEASDLLLLLLRTYLDAPPAQRQARVQGVFDVLERFYVWAERTQEYELAGILSECREAFVADVGRLHRASLGLSDVAAAAPMEEKPTLLRVFGVTEGLLEVVPADGADPVRVSNLAATADLRGDDLLLAMIGPVAEGFLELRGMVVVLPAAAESLLG